MGYHITITRGGDARPISESEFARATHNFSEVRHNASIGEAEYFRGEELRATLKLQDGEIWTKVPEHDVIALMLQLAERLGAEVRGDDGERFISPTESIPEEKDKTSDEERRGERRRHIRGAIWNTYRILVLAALLFFLVRKFLG